MSFRVGASLTVTRTAAGRLLKDFNIDWWFAPLNSMSDVGSADLISRLLSLQHQEVVCFLRNVLSKYLHMNTTPLQSILNMTSRVKSEDYLKEFSSSLLYPIVRYATTFLYIYCTLF